MMFVVLVKYTTGEVNQVFVHAVGPFANVERANQYVEDYVDAPTEKVVSLEVLDLHVAPFD